MRPFSDRGWLAASLLALAGFAGGLVWVTRHSFTRGAVYPEYSTLRADPRGAKALHDALARLPGVEVRRHLRPLRLLGGPPAAIFWLGEKPWTVAFWKQDEVDAFDRLLAGGHRLIIGFAPARAVRQEGQARANLVQQRWGVRVHLPVGSAASANASAWFELGDAAWTCLRERGGHCRAAERPVAAGTLVLLADAFPLTNEGLRDQRDPAWIAHLAGPHRRFVFDEEHLGVAEGASIGLLLAQFGQQGAALALLAAFVLFLWRAGAGFLPPRPPRPEPAAAGAAHQSLVRLLRRGIPESGLRDACLAEWRRSLPLLPVKHRTRAAGIGAALAAETPAPAAWRQARQRLQGDS